MTSKLQFGCDCNGMVACIRRAADPTRWNGADPGLGDMTLVEQSVWWTKYVVRKARALGLLTSSPSLYLTPESWMLGHLCQDCDDEIDEGQAVILIDIDYADRAGRAVAKLRHALCPCDADLYATGGDAEVTR